MQRFIATTLNLQAALALLWGRYVYGIPGKRDEGIDSSGVRNVLIVRLDEIGDFVMFTSALRGLRELFPGAHITLVVNLLVLNLIEPCPYADVKLGFDIGVRRALRPLVLAGRAMRFARSLARRTPFDLTILPRWGTDAYFATFLAFFSGARWRVGFSENSEPSKRIVNRGFDRLLTHTINDVAVRHQADYNWELVQYVAQLLHEPPSASPLPGGEIGRDKELDSAPEWGPLGTAVRSPSDVAQAATSPAQGLTAPADLELWLTDSDRAFCSQTLSDFDVSAADRLVAVCPSAGHSVLKQWPLDRFAEAVSRIAALPGARIMLVGSPTDQAASQVIAGAAPTPRPQPVSPPENRGPDEGLNPRAGTPAPHPEEHAARPQGVIDMTGRTTLRQMAALLEASTVFLGNDVGPMHIATAVGTPVVAIFGASCRHLYGPRGRGHRMLFRELPCSPCATGHKQDRCSRCIYDRPACLDAVTVDEVVGAVVDALSHAG
jgi:ADP-heptose:LPS heptosyltransferase